jgi:hypothetical protein
VFYAHSEMRQEALIIDVWRMCLKRSQIYSMSEKICELIRIAQSPGYVIWPRGPIDKASAYGAGDCRFESCRGHFFKSWLTLCFLQHSFPLRGLEPPSCSRLMLDGRAKLSDIL